jgi:hypothetical protein
VLDGGTCRDVVTGGGAGRRCRLAAPLALGALALFTTAAPAQTIRVDTAKDHAVQSFVPTAALGAGIDRISTTTTDTLFAPPCAIVFSPRGGKR